MASASLYNNPAFASGLSDMLRGFLGNPADEARNQVLAAKAGELNDTARYREAIGKATNLDQMLIAALQAGGEFGQAAPGIASSRASLPGAGYTPEQLAQIQIGTGTQTAQGTMPGLEATLANRLEGIRIPLDYEREDRAAGADAFAAAMRGYIDRLGQIESGWNGGAQNPNSSAGGYFQWTDDTASAYGVNKGDLDSEMAGIQNFTLDNANIISRVLGRNPTEAELYLAHQQGAGGASRLLGSPNARAVDLVGRDAVINNGGNENMTGAQFAQHVMGYYGGGGGAPAGVDQAGIAGLLLSAGNPALDDRQSDILQMLAEHYLDQDEGGGGDVSLTGEFEIDGVVYGKTKSGQLLPYTGPDGQPLRVDAGVPPTVGAAPGAPMPPEAPGALQTPFAASPYRQEPTVEEMLAAELAAPEGEMAPDMDPQQMEPFGLFPERPMKSYTRSALIDALGEDMDPMMGLSIVAAAEAMLRDNPAMTETQALAYASNPENLRRGPDVESRLPFGFGDKEGPVVGMKQPPEVEAILQEARDAIAAGADPGAVQARLRQMGISAPL